MNYKTKRFSDWLGNHVEVSYDKNVDVNGTKELIAVTVEMDTEDDEILSLITGEDCVQLTMGPIKIKMTFRQFHMATTTLDGPKVLATVEQRKAI